MAITAGVAALSGLLLFAAYLAVVVPGAWFTRASQRVFTPADMALAQGTGEVRSGALLVSSPGENGTTVITLNTDFRSDQYLGIDWRLKGIPDNAEVRLLWKTDVGGGRTSIANGVVEAGEVRPFVLARNPAWVGRVKGIALAVRAPLDAPLKVEAVVARPLSAADYLRERLAEWVTFEPFNGASINTLTGGADAQDLPLPAYAGVAFLIAAAVLLVLWRFGRGALRTGLGLACSIGGLFLAAWLLVDLRWAVNLARETRLLAATYAGKTPEERHRAAEDGELYAFIEKARAIMPKAPARVFVAAGEHYFRGRAAYHLYPHNVQFEAFRDFVAPPAWIKPGDWILVYHRRGVQYDAAQKMLRWDGNPPISAELKLLDAHGAALFLAQ